MESRLVEQNKLKRKISELDEAVQKNQKLFLKQKDNLEQGIKNVRQSLDEVYHDTQYYMNGFVDDAAIMQKFSQDIINMDEEYSKTYQQEKQQLEEAYQQNKKDILTKKDKYEAELFKLRKEEE